MEKNKENEIPNDKNFTCYDSQCNMYKSSNHIFNRAAVTSEVPLCSEIGVKILKRGGDAIDAGIATSICIGIVNSFSSGLGGGGFALYRDKGTGIDSYIDFREIAPHRIKEVEHIKDYSLYGATAIGVPGELFGLYKIKLKYSKSILSWKDLFIENINIARNGFKVSKELAKRIKRFENELKKDLGLKETYFINSSPAKEGDIIYRKNLANTLELIADNPMDFYYGKLMKRMVYFIQNNGGIVSENDFKTYEIRIKENKEVLQGTFHDYKIFTTSLPTSGPFLLMGLNIFEKYDLEEFKKKCKEEQIHIVVEIMKYMFACRGEFGDSENEKYNLLIKEITSKEYAKEIFNEIENKQIKDTEIYKMKTCFNDNYGTSHINVIDEEGRIFAVNTSINLEFGAKIMDPETGIIFNNQINDFYIPSDKNSSKTSNISENRVEPNKRPLSSMCPIILEKGNEKIVIGAAGGTRILTSVFFTLINTLIGKTMEEAISAKRIHHQLEPYKISYEEGFKTKILEHLKTKGNIVEESEIHGIFTSVQGIKTGSMGIEAFSDKRKGGESAGY